MNGLARSGTSILWNILLSHPQIYSNDYETWELLVPRFFRRSRIDKLFYYLLYIEKFKEMARKPISKYLDIKLFERLPSILINNEEKIFCTKSTGYALELSRIIADHYNCHTIFLIRNGFALCEGWIRRGEKPKKAALTYIKYCNKVFEEIQKNDNNKIVYFSDIMSNPFESAFGLYRHLGLDPIRIPQLRLKSKSRIKEKGRGKKVYRKEGHHYWFNPDDIKNILDKNIDFIQASRLSKKDRKIIEYHLEPINFAKGCSSCLNMEKIISYPVLNG